MHKIFIAQKSYCACHVLSLVTIRSKYYFNFILNRTRSGWEHFDRPSYIHSVSRSHAWSVTRPSNSLEFTTRWFAGSSSSWLRTFSVQLQNTSTQWTLQFITALEMYLCYRALQIDLYSLITCTEASQTGRVQLWVVDQKSKAHFAVKSSHRTPQ